MIKESNNNAYIDGANLHKGLVALGWELDYQKFRVWLREKYGITRAYLFIGRIPSLFELYQYLEESGFILVFKEVIFDGQGKPKGNCDADLVLRAVSDMYEGEYDKAVIVSSDGDYASLTSFLLGKQRMHTILAPSTPEKCSVLLKRTNVSIAYLNDQEGLLKKDKKKPPAETEFRKGLFRGE